MNAHAAAEAFAPRAEEAVGTFGAILGLGGIWNAEAVPESRHLGFALFGLGVFACVLIGARFVPKRLMILAAAGLGLATLAWLWPTGMAGHWSTSPARGLCAIAKSCSCWRCRFTSRRWGTFLRNKPWQRQSPWAASSYRPRTRQTRCPRCAVPTHR